MLSNKLTFSLVFLVMLAIIVTPAMAQRTLAEEDMVYSFTEVIPGVAGTPADDEIDDRFVLLTRATAGTPPGSEFGIAGVTEANLPANGIRRSTTDVATGLVSMPGDLKRFFDFYGTIELQVAVGSYLTDPASGATAQDIAVHTLVKDQEIEKATKAAADAAMGKGEWNHLVITEIMWALDDETTTKQWIEIYNNGKVTVASGTIADGTAPATGSVRAVFMPNRQIDPSQFPMYVEETDADRNGTADTNTTLYVVVDRVSTIDRFGTSWAPKGQNGNTEITASTAAGEVVRKGLINLVSMYRNRELEDADTPKAYKSDKTFGDGTAAGSWVESARRANMLTTYVGTPFWVHKVAKVFERTVASSGSGPVISEVRNDTSDANLDWVEIYNNGPAINLKKWELSIVYEDDDGKRQDMDVAALSHSDVNKERDYTLGANEYLLLTNTHPDNSILAGGDDIDVGAGEHINKGANHKYAHRPLLKLPNDRKFLLILRSALDKNNKAEAIEDYAGNAFIKVSDKDWETDVWPLQGTPALSDVAGLGNTTFAVTDNNMSWSRKRYNDNDGHHKDAWEKHGAKGGLGYVARADLSIAPGTPGYANGGVKEKEADLSADGSAEVTISEIMYDAGPRWNLIQWIEIYNGSSDRAVNLQGWQLEIRNKEDVASYVDSIITFESGAIVLPNQTLLLVSGTATNNVPGNRVYNLYEKHRTELGLEPAGRRSTLLSRTGFNLKLWQKGANRQTDDPIDEAGNVVVEGANRRIAWPDNQEEGLGAMFPRDDEFRQSLVRQYDTRMLDGNGPDAADVGTEASAWMQSDIAGAGISFYGHRNDVSTPGYRLGGPLPVSLSSFRPVRDKATGEVVIRWITQSELNNAGFNILRSETKTGEFKVVNLKGIIPGHGTTSEKHTYEWTDTTAKPNVVYYYQIEDVSLDGNRTTLATTHLRGNVNAAGKVTTTWGDLKTQ